MCLFQRHASGHPASYLRSLRRSGGLAVFWATAFAASPLHATVGPPVKISMLPDSKQAVAGQAYTGVFEVRLGSAGVLSDFRLEGQGWGVQSFDPPANGAAAGPGVVRIPFTATPADPGQLLRLSLRFDGRLVSRSLRLGKAAIAQARAAKQTVQVKAGSSAGAPQPQGAAMSLRFTGRIVYTRPKFLDSNDGPIWLATTDEGVDHIFVEVMDEDDITDETIWSGYTDQNGYFDSGNITWEDCDAFGCDEPDIYLRWECDTDIVNVQDGEDILETDYSWSNDDQVIDNFTGSFHDFGTWKPADLNQMAALHIHNSIIRVHRFLTDSQKIGLVISGLPEIDVQWPEGDNAFYDPIVEEIHISHRREWNEATHTHEYGHHLLQNAAQNVTPDYCNGFCDPDPNPPFPDCGHCSWCPETDHDAWNEGFPNWLADIVTRDYPFNYQFSDGSPYTALIPRDLENTDVCNEDNQFHSPWITEGFIGALLRDIEDSTAFDGSSLQDDHDGDGICDCLELGYNEIFTIALIDEVITPTQFITAFIARYPEHMPGLYSTAFNVHPWYVSDFPTDTQPPGVVPYVTSPSHPPIVGSTSPCIELHLGPVADDVVGACGFSYEWTTIPTGLEPDMDEEGNYVAGSCCIVSPVRNLGDHWISLRAKDCAGHWSNEWATFGPFRVTECNGNGILDVCEIPCYDVCWGSPCSNEPVTCGNACDASVLADDVDRPVRLKCRPHPNFCQNVNPGGICGLGRDCNLNLTPDECDISSGTSQDCNQDGIPDECQNMAHWVAGGGGSWHVNANWQDGSFAGLPGSGQIVCINVPDADVTVTHTTGTTSILSLACHENLNLNSTTANELTIVGNALDPIDSFVLGNLTLGGRNTNTLRNNNKLTISGLLSISQPSDGGGHYWLRGTGPIVANGGMSVTRAALLPDPDKVIDLNNNSTATATHLIQFNSNNGVAVRPGSTYICNGNFTAFSGGASSLLFVEGVFRRASGTGDVIIDCPLKNAGEVRVQTGTLRMADGNNDSTGQFIGEPGTMLEFGAGTHSLTPTSSLTADNVRFSGGGTSNVRGSVSIVGTLAVSLPGGGDSGHTCTFTNEANVTSYGQHLSALQGSVRFEAPKTGPAPLFDTVTIGQNTSGGKNAHFNTGQPVSINTLNLVMGNIEGADLITINNSFVWGNGGGSILAGGAITCNGPVTIQAASSSRNLFRTFNNYDYATFLGGFTMGSGGAFYNMATGTIDIRNITTVLGLTTVATLHNHGLLIKSAGTGISTIASHFRNTGTVEIQTGTLQFTGTNGLTHIQTAGQTTINGGTLSVTNNAPYQVQGGELRGIGTVAALVQNTGGNVAPGLSVGTLNIVGNYTHGASGTLRIELGGLVAGTEHDQLTVSGTATLQGGTVDVAPFGGFIPQVGQQFVIFTAGSVQGTFSGVTGPGAYTLTHNPTNVTLTVTQAPCAQIVGPDFDLDCDVDAVDVLAFIYCATRSGVAVASGCEPKDLDGDLDADLFDFALVQRCYAGAAIPADVSCDD